ncbi:MAG: TIGR00266 family protein [Bryobacteraceae bacterium]|nr:TIGR00266 family protein [Bryobacteraceae bacterium]
MPYCTSCGTEIADTVRFCARCGTPAPGYGASMPNSGAYAPPVIDAGPLDYTIQGDNLQVVRVRLRPGQEMYAEAGKMLYMTNAISWETRMTGDSLGQKIWGALKRKLMGESLFLTYFRSSGQGEVGFAGNYPGRIQDIELKPGQAWLVQRDSFVCAQAGVQLNIALVKRIGAGFFGGEGFILQKLTGPGHVFIHGGGDFIDFQLQPGEQLRVDTGCVVGFEESVSYDIQLAGGIKTAIFGGEGLFLTTLTGPGRVIVQSMTLEKLRRELTPARSGGDERGPLESLGGFFRSED